jgi:hypothetical protein
LEQRAVRVTETPRTPGAASTFGIPRRGNFPRTAGLKSARNGRTPLTVGWAPGASTASAPSRRRRQPRSDDNRLHMTRRHQHAVRRDAFSNRESSTPPDSAPPIASARHASPVERWIDRSNAARPPQRRSAPEVPGSTEQMSTRRRAERERHQRNVSSTTRVTCARLRFWPGGTRAPKRPELYDDQRLDFLCWRIAKTERGNSQQSTSWPGADPRWVLREVRAERSAHPSSHLH